MQRLLTPDGPWPVPWAEPALVNIVGLVERRAERTIFTRFVPPQTAEEMPGVWRQYYEKWWTVTREFLRPELIDLLPPLPSFVPPARIVDKQRYSAFAGSALQRTLQDVSCDTLIVSGAETDVCVLATVMSAVDRGYRVIVASDAICSSSDQCHDALMTLYHQRFSLQIEIADAATILDSWNAP
jgi:nicotinamidase-related amidase